MDTSVNSRILAREGPRDLCAEAARVAAGRQSAREALQLATAAADGPLCRHAYIRRFDATARATAAAIDAGRDAGAPVPPLAGLAVSVKDLFDVAGMLGTAPQRLAAAIGLLVFLAVLAMLELPILHESLRQGRQLELRLRMALLRKLPRLHDRYFQSRPISDMADRAHGLQLTRGLPGLGFNLVRTLFELALTLAGVLVIAPHSTLPALALVLLVVLSNALFHRPLVDSFLFAVALAVGLNLLPRFGETERQIWNTGVVINVLGAGISRIMVSVLRAD